MIIIFRGVKGSWKVNISDWISSGHKHLLIKLYHYLVGLQEQKYILMHKCKKPWQQEQQCCKGHMTVDYIMPKLQKKSKLEIIKVKKIKWKNMQHHIKQVKQKQYSTMNHTVD